MTNRLELNWELDGFVDEQRYYCSETPIDSENLPLPKAVLAENIRAYTDFAITEGATYYVCVGSVRNGIEKLSEIAIVTASMNDEYWVNVTSLLRFNGSNNSTTFTDEKGNVWSAYGSATLSTVQSKFGGSSLRLIKASNQFLSTPYSPNIDLLTGAFTIEGWFYPVSVVSGGTILFCTGGGAIAWNGTNGIHINLQTTTAGKLYVQLSKNSGSPFDVSTTATLNLGAWNFISASWDGATKVYAGVNGVVQEFTTSGIARPSTNPTAIIGTIPGLNSGANLYDGYVDDFRITKGVCRYTASFTPPDSEAPNF